MKEFILIVVFILGMTACEDRYRYPCQDPSNHNAPDCNPPACVADGSCTEYLIKK